MITRHVSRFNRFLTREPTRGIVSNKRGAVTLHSDLLTTPATRAP